jgi:hypothetical protein
MKKSVCILVTLALFLFPALTQAKVSMEILKRVKYINTNELYSLFKTKADFVLINTLSPIEFAEKRIKGSINVPYTCLKKGQVQLPEDTSKKLIFYCKGPK